MNDPVRLTGLALIAAATACFVVGLVAAVVEHWSITAVCVPAMLALAFLTVQVYRVRLHLLQLAASRRRDIRAR